MTQPRIGEENFSFTLSGSLDGLKINLTTKKYIKREKHNLILYLKELHENMGPIHRQAGETYMASRAKEIQGKGLGLHGEER